MAKEHSSFYIVSIYYITDEKLKVETCSYSDIIQGGPKVGIPYIVNYCILTVYLLLAHPA